MTARLQKVLHSTLQSIQVYTLSVLNFRVNIWHLFWKSVLCLLLSSNDVAAATYFWSVLIFSKTSVFSIQEPVKTHKVCSTCIRKKRHPTHIAWGKVPLIVTQFLSAHSLPEKEHFQQVCEFILLLRFLQR